MIYAWYLGPFVSRKVVFWKLFSKLSYVYLSLKKLVNEKHFSVKEKYGFVSRKVFSFYFGRKALSRNCEKFRNIMLFADYIKFDPQTFDCYIFCFESFFSISSLRICYMLLNLILIFFYCCCNPFLDPRTKKKKIQKNQKNIVERNSKNNSSENRMPERPKNDQNLVEEVQKYKD